ncbi:nucleotidyltransferase domain-containing protein [Bacillus sp. H-16]|uniref:nucleotidyltransferase domain-containing protein n=1 Tax=Alteribacter salitolerans TaxID=2912333 RepID=UPI001965A449|nr:nucleotidyltransferase domain-containing protein [Alteribacter salitolerans]MBM7097488.1 nucleotidyltransferase domain-containing protein [Alteribacter salitolerans]
MKRRDPFKTAQSFIKENYPECEGALLAGSTVRGQTTSTSDLDIVVFSGKVAYAFRKSLTYNGWPVEVFVYNLNSYRDFFKSDADRGRPCLQRMFKEGKVLADSGLITGIKKEAEESLNAGPAEWDEPMLRMKQYFLTDLLDDFTGSDDRGEGIFIAGSLGEAVHEFLLRTNGQWIGASKWIVRSLNEYDESMAKRFINAFDTYYRTGEKGEVISLVEDVLEPFGGRLFEGYSIGKE